MATMLPPAVRPRWRYGPELSVGRCAPLAAVLPGEHMIVVGGYGGGDTYAAHHPIFVFQGCIES